MTLANYEDVVEERKGEDEDTFWSWKIPRLEINVSNNFTLMTVVKATVDVWEAPEVQIYVPYINASLVGGQPGT